MKIATFAHIANYYVPINMFVKNALEIKTIVPPPITKKTLELGSKNSPDFVCAPFKYNLGNFIESLELGANLIIQAGGGCRFGYYGELQEQILRDLGYEFDFLNINQMEISSVLKECKRLKIKVNIFKVAFYLYLALKMVKLIDDFEDYLRKNIGFEEVENSFDNLHQEFLKKLEDVKTFRRLKKVAKIYYNKLLKIKINKPENVLKVGIVGELYTIQDQFSNHYIEKELAKNGIEIKRFITMNYLLNEHKQLQRKKVGKYVTSSMGATGLDSICNVLDLIKENYDGIIHVKSFGCTPEINAMPSLQNIANDFEIPIIYFSFDTATSETGIKTRLEAFYDMLLMRRDKS